MRIDFLDLVDAINWIRISVISRRIDFSNCSLTWILIFVFGGIKTYRPFVIFAKPFA